MKKVKFIIKNFEELISGIFISITVLIVITNVILRYFFNTSMYWAEEVATICFVWSVFIGASACYKLKMNIGIDFLLNKGSAKVQSIVKYLVDVLLLIITGYIFYLSIIFTKLSSIKPTAVLGVSSVVINGALLVGFGIMTIHAIRFIIMDTKNIMMTSKKEEM